MSILQRMPTPTAPLINYSENELDELKIDFSCDSRADTITYVSSFFSREIDINESNVFKVGVYTNKVLSEFILKVSLDRKIKNLSSSKLDVVNKKLNLLRQIEEGREFDPPSDTAIENTRKILTVLIEEITFKEYLWIDPIIYSDEFGVVSVEWRLKTKVLYFDIEENDIQYTKIWGPKENVRSETDDLSIDNCLSLWKWLINAK